MVRSAAPKIIHFKSTRQCQGVLPKFCTSTMHLEYDNQDLNYELGEREEEQAGMLSDTILF